MMHNLRPHDKEKAQIEILVICISYTSLFCNEYFTNRSEKIDNDLLNDLEEYLRNSPYLSIIETEFGYSGIVNSIDDFIRTRLLSARNEFSKVGVSNRSFERDVEFEEQISYSDSPINIYNAVMKNPLEKSEDVLDSYSGNLSSPVYEFESKIAKLLIGLIKYLQEKIPEFYSVLPTLNFDDNSYSIAHQSIDFTHYYPLYNNFCVECGQFRPSEKMGNGIVHTELGAYYSRICNQCNSNKIDVLGEP